MPKGLTVLPEITSEDIDWVSTLLKLTEIDAPRRDFLTSLSTLDVSACPGSGKTTLIVAKLAILARKWPYRSKGICVLSHTNVAREEIQRRLGNTVVGQRLLCYPHFIDTIHGFVNRFLALPWLASNGYPSATIDDNLTTERRRSVLGSEYFTVQTFLANRHSDFAHLRICARDLSFGLKGKEFPARPNSQSYSLAKRAIEEAARAGYFCYDEMFVWANSLLDDVPDVTSWLRRRFPLIILDEMQDTTKLQGQVIHRIFPGTSYKVVIQRVGDPNQAIFDYIEDEADDSEPFPYPGRNLTISNSRRFGPAISTFASPFALTSVGTDGLKGIGPRAMDGVPTECANTIFIFPDNSTEGVLNAYGKHVLASFNDIALNAGTVTALGAVHRDAPDVKPEDHPFPKSVPHYWSGYTAKIARKEPHPESFVQYIRVGQAAIRDSRNLSRGVERMASGLLRLANQIGNTTHIKHKVWKHRMIISALQSNPSVLAGYHRLIRRLFIDWIPLNENNWGEIRIEVLAIACALCNGKIQQNAANGFLAWSGEDRSLAVNPPKSPNDAGPNVYRVCDDNRCVDIRLSSIHMAKGQTHLATLILDTFWHKPWSHRMINWLLGTKTNGNNAAFQDCKRLLLTYVAMTRPSHMLCLAMRRTAFGYGAVFTEQIATLYQRGWRVAEIIDGLPSWYSTKL